MNHDKLEKGINISVSAVGIALMGVGIFNGVQAWRNLREEKRKLKSQVKYVNSLIEEATPAEKQEIASHFSESRLKWFRKNGVNI